MEPPSPLAPKASSLPSTVSQDVDNLKEGRRFSLREAVVLAVITIVGTFLRLALAWGRPRINDEVGTLLDLRMSVGYLLTHFAGKLTMNYFIVAEKGVAALTHSEGWALEILPMLGAIACIPLTASLARRLGGGAHFTLTAAALVAFNPYLLKFSPILRSYSLLAALAVWSVDLFFQWRERRTWAAGAAAALVILLMLLMHPNGIYVVGGLSVLLGWDAIRIMTTNRHAGRWAQLTELRTFLGPLALAGMVTFLAYRPLVHDVQVFTVKWSAAPPTSLEYIPSVLADYLGTGFASFVPGALLLAGVWSATQTRRSLLPLCLLAGLSPILVSLKGVSHYPWAYARFQIYCLPFLLILLAEGINWLAALVPGKSSVRMAVLSSILVAAVIAAWVPDTAQVFAEKRASAAYVETAAYLQIQRRTGDVVVVEGSINHLDLQPLLPRGADGPIRAEDFFTKPGTLPATARVFFVAPSQPPLGDVTARRTFGDLQVVTYQGPTATACESLRTDLTRAVSARSIDSTLADTYQLLALLDKQLSAARGTNAREWHLLAQLCKTRDRRYLFMPPQMRARENGSPDSGTTGATSARDKAAEEN